MRRVRLLLILSSLVLLVMASGCAAPGAYGPYSTTYGVPTLAMTAAGAAIGSTVGPGRDRAQNAVIGGIIGAMAGTAVEYSIYEQERQRRYAQQQYYQQQYDQTQVYVEAPGTCIRPVRTCPRRYYRERPYCY